MTNLTFSSKGKVRLSFFTIIFLFSIISLIGQAPCTIHLRDGGDPGNTSGPGTGLVGQSFTACADGQIVSVAVTHTTTYGAGIAGDYNLYISFDPGSGVPISTTTPVATVNLGSPPTNGQIMTFNLASPFLIDNGVLYRFVILHGTGGAMNFIASNDEYPGGTFINTNSKYTIGADLDFQIEVGVAPPPSPYLCTVNGLKAGNDCSCNGMGATGSTFLPCTSGHMRSLTVVLSTIMNQTLDGGTYELYVAPDPGSGNAIATTSVASVVVASAQNGDLLTFDINPAIPLDAGTLYRFMIDNPSANSNFLAEMAPGSYTDGGFVSSTNVVSDPVTGTDLIFEIKMGTPPNFSKSFADPEVPKNQTTTLSFLIENTSEDLEANSAAFTDNLPAGLQVADAPNVVANCTGTVMADPGSTLIDFSGGIIPANSTCQISIDVKVTETAILVNTSEDLLSNLGNSGTATATILGLAPIPTLSQWGIIVLGILILIFGIAVLKKSIKVGKQKSIS